MKHLLLDTLRLRRSRRGDHGRREKIYVDASFSNGDRDPSGDGASGGVGVWVPRRRIAIALKVDVRTSMEAETLALLAGAMVAKRLNIRRPVIVSDCKTVVTIATRHLHVGRRHGALGKLRRLFQLAGEHRAFRHIYDAMHGLGGTLAWQPREQNREADLASSIGSRVGNMGILLSGGKNQNHALNDVLSLASREVESDTVEQLIGSIVHRKYRGGTRTVSLASQAPMPSRTFARQAKHLIANISSEVA